MIYKEEEEGMGKLLDLLVASLIPVIKLLIITALGSFLALDSVDILGMEARKHLNNVVFFVFNPALVATNLAKYITLNNLLFLWFMPLNILFTFIIGSLLGCLLIRITDPPRALRGLVLGCCAAGNLGNMPLIIIPAVCKERGSPFGQVKTCYAHGLAYGSLSMAVGAVYMWSYVYNIMRLYSNRSPQGPKFEALAHAKSSLTDSHAEFELVSMSSEHKDKIKYGIQIFGTMFNMRRLFAPSTIGAIVGFAVGVIPHVQEVVIGDKAPLRVVQDSAALLGEAAIPTVTLVVGANLLEGLKGSEVRSSVVIGIMAVRYIALPLTGIIIIKSAVHFGLVHTDPLYQFVLLLQFALPPAMNIGTMSQLFGTGESECSVILLASYAMASVAVTIWSTIFMWLVA
ncbi:Protein PIN-LIKES 1 [Linum perenne]